MKLTLEELKMHRVVPYPLDIQNYLLRLLGSGAYNLYSVADNVDAGDFISFNTPPDYVACVTSEGDLVTLAITTKRLKEWRKADMLANASFQLSDSQALYIVLLGDSLVIVEAHYKHRIQIQTTGLLDKSQAIDLARRLIRGAM